MIRTGVCTDSKIGGRNLECGIAKQNKLERAMAYSASVQTFQEEYLAFLKKRGALFDEKYLWHQLRPIRPYPMGRFFRWTLSQALRAWRPGTSCLATISLSLRDKAIRPSKSHALS